MENQSGVYVITNQINGKMYIGSTARLKSRKHEHWSYLRRGIHGNRHLQNSYDLYGESNFVFSVLEVCGNDIVLEREQHYIDTLKPEYNKRVYASNNRGCKPSEKTKALWSKNRKGKGNGMFGKFHSEEAKQKVSQANSGRKMSDEQKRKISEKLKGRKQSESWLEKRRSRPLSPMQGKHHSEEWKVENGARKKKWWDTNHDKYAGENHWLYGKPQSEETKAKRSASLKEWWRKRKFSGH